MRSGSRVPSGTSGSAEEATALRQREAAVVRAFQALPDRMDRYRYLADRARALPVFPESEKTDETLVPGCSAELWLKASVHEGRVQFAVDSPSLVVKGVAAILIEVLSDLTPEAILGADLTFLKTIDLERQLSANRSNGLSAMVQRMRSFAASNLGG